jgi:uncharacterized RDD family membrane protein YckC
MSRREPSDEPSLFDLPLVPDDDTSGDEAARARRREVEPQGGETRVGETAAARAAADPHPPADPADPPGPAAEPGLDDWLFAPDPLAEDLPGERTAGPHPAAPAGTGFPFGDRPPPHRPAPPRPATPQTAAPPAVSRPASRPLVPAADPAGWDVVDVLDDEPEPADDLPSAADAAPVRAGLAPRLVAAACDGLVLAVAAALALIGAALLDVRPGAEMLPGLAALLLVFSFAYSVVPLAFWGATPGMRAVRLVARDRDGGPLTFGQTAARWAGGLLTLALAGLPMLLALGPLGGRSPADRLSRSLTWQRR